MRRLILLGLLLVFAVPAAAATPRILPFQDRWPVWSPDGTHIAFTRTSNYPLMQLEVVDVRTGTVTRVAQANYQLAPSWSPDGTKLAYQAGDDIYVWDLHGGRHRIGKGHEPAYGDTLARLQNGKLLVGGVEWAPLARSPVWSPDRRSIAFRTEEGVYVAEGPGKVRVVATASETGFPSPPSWSPDGTQLAYALDGFLWVASRGIVPPRKIGRGDTEDAPSWSQDGGSVVYASLRNGVTRTYLTGRSVVLHRGLSLGAAFSPVSDKLAWAGARPVCPGHISILLQERPLTGSCDVSGTPRADVIEGSLRENDVILAGAGNDRIHANDRHTDRVNCGPGRDTVWADRQDKLTACEIVHR